MIILQLVILIIVNWLCLQIKINVWDFETGNCIKTLNDHLTVINSVKISKDKKWIVSGGNDSTMVNENIQ
jgi:WD40 repeat protein